MGTSRSFLLCLLRRGASSVAGRTVAATATRAEASLTPASTMLESVIAQTLMPELREQLSDEKNFVRHWYPAASGKAFVRAVKR